MFFSWKIRHNAYVQSNKDFKRQWRSKARDVDFGWDHPQSERTSRFGKGPPIREAGPNRERRAWRERGGPLKPALTKGPAP